MSPRDHREPPRPAVVEGEWGGADRHLDRWTVTSFHSNFEDEKEKKIRNH